MRGIENARVRSEINFFWVMIDALRFCVGGGDRS